MTVRGLLRTILQRTGSLLRCRRPAAGTADRAAEALVLCTETVQHALDVPPDLAAGRAILVAPRPHHPEWLAMDCPCGHGHQLLVNLSMSRTPRWKMSRTPTGAVTLHPSIDSHSEVGRCHFILRAGTARWIQPPAAHQESATTRDPAQRPRQTDQ